ncbi:AcrR family transcriptional regulator [Naumannella cuiyingiana]|uniref:AcrR family transcriptional regulator n=1 Tax=Naumannella cuiyingiana TaxID=1347891 RepID=A0A7Z0DAD3_9ACTN|nr:TetR/AcrR family transcriptional regulator [Naumannella cuiyingiana]NYI71712.1 AcrR family transcriptional regulator [Naumannella cuiyingiana]
MVERRQDPHELTIELSPPRAERADAARNRAHALEVAAHLFARRGVAAVTMDEIAAEAGVGKGTLYRRFGDKGGLASALLGERERALQQQMISGPAPIGPGADPIDRLVAFVEAYLLLALDNIELLEMSETNSPGARFRSGAHSLWVTHCRILLDAAGAANADVRAQVLMAALAAEQLRHWTEDEDRDPDELARSLAELARSLAGHRPRTAR